MTEIASSSWRPAKTLTDWQVLYAINMAIACGISYAVMTQGLAPFVDEKTTLLGGMWATVATVFVFRESRLISWSAGIARFLATCVSFALCLAYFLLFPFTTVGLAAILGLGTIVLMLLGREQDIVTTGITTAVVMVAAGMNPHAAWEQPIFRLIETIVGITVGVTFKWIASYAFYRIVGQPPR